MNIQPPIVTQPQMGQPNRNDWQTELCDCFSDCEVCLCGFFCFPCLGCRVASDMDECCLCGPTVPMRSVYRTKYNIPGSICKDFCIVGCCPLCSLCQIQRDIKLRKAMGAF